MVYTAAVKDDNPELMEAGRQGIPCMDRATLLGQIMETFRFAIGVAGSHGKTTTTSMLAMMMHRADWTPLFWWEENWMRLAETYEQAKANSL